jgi:hypothetical protein
MADITFEVKARIGNKATGRLKWPAKNLDSAAISGPHGNGTLPNGVYSAPRNKLLDKTDAPYCDADGNCWMQALDNAYDRTDLGIHPDGGVSGTLGCIGVLDSDTSNWYEAFKSRPSGSVLSLVVKDVESIESP